MEGSTGRKLICIVLMGIGLVILLINLIFYEMESKIDSKFPTTMKIKVLKGFDEGLDILTATGDLHKSNKFIIHKDSLEFDGKIITVDSDNLIELMKSSEGFNSIKEYITESEDSMEIKTPVNTRVAISINEKKIVRGLSEIYIFYMIIAGLLVCIGFVSWQYNATRGWSRW